LACIVLWSGEGCGKTDLGAALPTSLGEFTALATAIVSLAAAVAYWLVYATREVKGTAGAAVKTASTALLAALLAGVMAMNPGQDWLWLIPLGLALGALGDLFLALTGMRMFLAGVGAFGAGHLAYAAGFLLRARAIGFDGLGTGEIAALVGLLGSTEVWLAPRTGELRAAVRGYVGLIGLMGVAAILLPAHPGIGALRLGAGLFLLSDLLLALQMFVLRDPAGRRLLALTLWPAYWAGQALIAWGAVAFWQAGAG
jgi:uncharacterized membrane protein YhhN